MTGFQCLSSQPCTCTKTSALLTLTQPISASATGLCQLGKEIYQLGGGWGTPGRPMICSVGDLFSVIDALDTDLGWLSGMLHH
jgi:hypothetical protein